MLEVKNAWISKIITQMVNFGVWSRTVVVEFAGLSFDDLPRAGATCWRQQNPKIAVSHEILIVERSLTPQNVRKTHFSISVSYIVYPSDDRKWLEMLIKAN